MKAVDEFIQNNRYTHLEFGADDDQTSSRDEQQNLYLSTPESEVRDMLVVLGIERRINRLLRAGEIERELEKYYAVIESADGYVDWIDIPTLEFPSELQTNVVSKKKPNAA